MQKITELFVGKEFCQTERNSGEVWRLGTNNDVWGAKIERKFELRTVWESSVIQDDIPERSVRGD